MSNKANFPRTYSLANQLEIKQVFDNARKVSQKHLLILFKPNQKIHARLGIIVGKRVASSAVVRNRIRRVIRESFRLTQEKLIGLDIIVIARHPCAVLDKEKLRQGIDELWEKLIKSLPTLAS